MSHELVIEGRPIPKARPRCGRGAHDSNRVYTPATTTMAEAAIGWQWKAAHGDGAMYLGPVRVELVFFEPPGHPADLDNLTKLVLDALNGIAWSDDRQVTYLEAAVVRSAARPPQTWIRIDDVRDDDEAEPGGGDQSGGMPML